MLIAPFLLRLKVNYSLLAHAIGILALINFCLNIGYGGGFDSPVVIWFAIFPTLTLMLQDLRNSIPWFIIVMLVFSILFAIRKMYGKLPSIVPEEIYYEMTLFLYCGFTMVIFLIVIVFDRTQKMLLTQLEIEKNKSEALLLNILPEEVAEELKMAGYSNAKLYNEVTVMFTDFKGFTQISEQLSPQALVNELHHCFSAFDAIVHKHGVEKIKTVGDAYLAVSGLPANDPLHALHIIEAALEIRDFMKQRRAELGNNTFEIRIGLHTGQVVAGIVGVKKFAYDIWGDTVNIAARMEQNSDAGKINLSQSTYEQVKNAYHFSYRGKIEAKNKGQLDMYFVERKPEEALNSIA